MSPKLSQTEAEPLSHRLMKAALGYAARGWRVHPLHPGSKIPMLTDWTEAASTDPDLIKTWWTDHPEANVGIATGVESDLWVLDVDTAKAKGKKGKKSLKKLQATHGDLPPTYTARTASGGLHYYYRYPKGPGDWRNSATYLDKLGKKNGPLEPDLDVRAEGGQVAAWPSVIAEYDGASYSVENDRKPAKLPKVYAALTRRVEPLVPVRPSIDPATLTDGDKDRVQKWTVSAVNAIIDDLHELRPAPGVTMEGYSGPPWNETTFKKAVRLVEIASASWSPISVEDARDILVQNAPRDSGFTDSTVSGIWRSALKRVDGQPPLSVPITISSPYIIPFSGGEVAKARPDEYVIKGDGLLAAKLAEDISENLAVGADGGLWVYEAGVWSPGPDELVKRMTRSLGDKYRRSMVATVEDIVRTSPAVVKLSSDALEGYINTRSGMFDWRTGVLLPHDPSYLSMIQLPIEYVPSASCPNFDRWVSQVVQPDTVKLLWQVIGYMLLNGNPLQKAILFFGPGGNGKGTLIRILERMIGAHNVSEVTLRHMSEGKFEIAKLYGKQANLAGDIDSLYLRDSSTFKSLTGQDRVLAQHKNKDPFSFVCHAVPLFSGNELWRSSDTTAGYFRRWIHVPFPNKVSGKLDEALLFAEAPGIFNKAMAALRELMETREFDRGLSAAILASDFESQSDLVRVWISEDDRVSAGIPGEEGPGTWTRRTEVYDRFRSWALESGHTPLSSTKFYRRIGDGGLGYVSSRRGAQGHGFYGLTITPAVAYMTAPPGF